MKHLAKDDEFYKIGFSQIAIDENSGKATALEVKAVTYALMSWWKGQGNEDIIDIEEGSNSSTLDFTWELDIDNEDGSNQVTCYFEADEEKMLLTLYIYPVYPGAMTKDEMTDISERVLYLSSKMKYGALEIVQSDEDEYIVRTKIGACMKGVKRGKIEIVRNLFQHGIDSMSSALLQLSQN